MLTEQEVRQLAVVLKPLLQRASVHRTELVQPAPVVNYQPPPPAAVTVVNDVHPTPVAAADVEPIATLLAEWGNRVGQIAERLLAATVEAQKVTAELLNRMLEVLEKQPAPSVVVRPNITLEMPKRDAELAALAQPKRTFRITHDDGTVSTVTEE